MTLLDYVTQVSNFIWGGTWGDAQILPFPPMVIVLLGAGILFMVRLKFYPILKLPAAFMGLFKKSDEPGEGEISPFAALSTALSGQVGTGNLAGVATAITLGGPGALFWMWVTAIFGMALAFAEGSLAIRYRTQDENGHYRGGPMNYITQGLGPKWKWLAIVFCIGTLISSISTGNMIQANAVADSITGLVPAIPEWGAGMIVAAAVFVVIIGGIKSIGSVAEKVVPTMAIAYLIMALIAVLLNIQSIPIAFAEIFGAAFTGQAAAGGFTGAGVMLAIRAGFARGLFSNEAGQGSTAMAHAVARTNDPARQGRFAMMGTFIDTMVICTMTGLVLLTVQGAFPGTDASGAVAMQDHVWKSDFQGFDMTSAAYSSVYPFQVFAGITIGQLVASAALILFSFTTLLTWGYYGERAVTYLSGGRTNVSMTMNVIISVIVASVFLGPRIYAQFSDSLDASSFEVSYYLAAALALGAIAMLFITRSIAMGWRALWCVMIFVGSFQEIELVWRTGDIANATMAFPNLIALIMLSTVVVGLAKGDRTAGVDHEDTTGHNAPPKAAPAATPPG